MVDRWVEINEISRHSEPERVLWTLEPVGHSKRRKIPSKRRNRTIRTNELENESPFRPCHWAILLYKQRIYGPESDLAGHIR